MKRFVAIVVLLGFFLTAFAVGGEEAQQPEKRDSLQSVFLYTEGLKALRIHQDTARGRELLELALQQDSSYAPAYFALVTNNLSRNAEEALKNAEKAYRQDTANLWYHRAYGQALLMNERYTEALPIYRSLNERDPKDLDFYRILAALYEQNQQPYSAIATLDSAEVRMGRHPYLSKMKRHLLIQTKQTDRALEEAKTMVKDMPYEAEHHVVLAELYGVNGDDSLARQEYNEAMKIDSTNLETLMSMSDFFNGRRDYRSMLWVTRKMFQLEEFPLEQKVRRFELFTSDIDFYRNNYFQLHDLASLLTIYYPTDKRVVKLYADHLIASGQLEEALKHYKTHLQDRPAVEDYYLTVIDIESYLERPDSVKKYVNEALTLFPDKIELHLAEGNVRYRMGNLIGAVMSYKKALKFADTDSLRSQIWGQIGDVHHAYGEASGWLLKRMYQKDCYKAYKKALKYNPDNILVLNNWAYFLSLDGKRLDEALRMAERANELSPRNPTYMDTQAWILFKLDHLEEARQLMRQAVALDGQQSKELLLHYGDILHALGEQFMAETYWKKALDKGYDKAVIEERMKQPKIEKKRPETQQKE